MITENTADALGDAYRRIRYLESFATNARGTVLATFHETVGTGTRAFLPVPREVMEPIVAIALEQARGVMAELQARAVEEATNGENLA